MLPGGQRAARGSSVNHHHPSELSLCLSHMQPQPLPQPQSAISQECGQAPLREADEKPLDILPVSPAD